MSMEGGGEGGGGKKREEESVLLCSCIGRVAVVQDRSGYSTVLYSKNRNNTKTVIAQQLHCSHIVDILLIPNILRNSGDFEPYQLE